MSQNDEQRESARNFLRLYDEYFHKRGLGTQERKEVGRKLMIAGGSALQAFGWPEITLDEIHARLTDEGPELMRSS